MTRIDTVLFDARALEIMAARDTAIHRLDPRAKLVTTLVFALTVMSWDKYTISGLLPFFIFPVMIAALGNIPVGYLLRKLLLVSPFALLIAIANPFFDRELLFYLSGIPVSGGLASFFSILLRFLLTVSACLLLIATSGLSEVCLAMDRLGAPRIFIVQLLFLYRYLYILIEEGARLVRARGLRSFHGRGQGLAGAGPLLGQLLLRTLGRARRIHLAMLCRGFTGEIRLPRPFRMHAIDWIFLCGWVLTFLLLRITNLSLIIDLFLARIIAL